MNVIHETPHIPNSARSTFASSPCSTLLVLPWAWSSADVVTTVNENKIRNVRQQNNRGLTHRCGKNFVSLTSIPTHARRHLPCVRRMHLEHALRCEAKSCSSDRNMHPRTKVDDYRGVFDDRLLYRGLRPCICAAS